MNVTIINNYLKDTSNWFLVRKLNFWIFSSVPFASFWRSGPLWAPVRYYLKSCTIHLRRHGDSPHRDQMGLQVEERRLLRQLVSTSDCNKQSKNILHLFRQHFPFPFRVLLKFCDFFVWSLHGYFSWLIDLTYRMTFLPIFYPHDFVPEKIDGWSEASESRWIQKRKDIEIERGKIKKVAKSLSNFYCFSEKLNFFPLRFNVLFRWPWFDFFASLSKIIMTMKTELNQEVHPKSVLRIVMFKEWNIPSQGELLWERLTQMM